MPVGTDDAVIAVQGNAWPCLPGNTTIDDVNMGDGADIDVQTHTLTAGQLTINASSTVTISGSTGKVYPTSIVINGGSTVTVVGGKIQTR